MDDRTLIICAATLCVIGVSLTQVLGPSGGPRGTSHQVASVNGAALPAINIDGLSGRAADALAGERVRVFTR